MSYPLRPPPQHSKGCGSGRFLLLLAHRTEQQRQQQDSGEQQCGSGAATAECEEGVLNLSAGRNYLGLDMHAAVRGDAPHCGGEAGRPLTQD